MKKTSRALLATKIIRKLMKCCVVMSIVAGCLQPTYVNSTVNVSSINRGLENVRSIRSIIPATHVPTVNEGLGRAATVALSILVTSIMAGNAMGSQLSLGSVAACVAVYVLINEEELTAEIDT